MEMFEITKSTTSIRWSTAIWGVASFFMDAEGPVTFI